MQGRKCGGEGEGSGATVIMAATAVAEDAAAAATATATEAKALFVVAEGVVAWMRAVAAAHLNRAGV